MICHTCHNAVKDGDWKHTGSCWKLGKITLFQRFWIWFFGGCGEHDPCRQERCKCLEYMEAKRYQVFT